MHSKQSWTCYCGVSSYTNTATIHALIYSEDTVVSIEDIVYSNCREYENIVYRHSSNEWRHSVKPQYSKVDP